MTFSLISAENLDAVYESTTETLTLHADGMVMPITYDIHFQRITLMGGLLFALEGISNVVMGPSDKYSIDDKFHIKLPNRVYPTNEIIVQDLNNPRGKTIPIRWLNNDGPKPSSDGLKDSGPVNIPQASSGNDINMNVIYRKPFQIKHSCELPKFGTIQIDFDHKVFEMETSTIDDGNIVWKFNSLQTGKSQIRIIIGGGIAQYVRVIYYDVHVWLASQDTEEDATQKADDAKAILGYDGRVNIAVRKVLQQYKDAILLYVDGHAPPRYGVLGTSQLPQFTARFAVNEGNDNVTIESPSIGVYGPVTFHKGAWVGTAKFNWPPPMLSNQATEILRKRGFSGRFYDLTLRRPIYHGITQEYWIFTLDDGRVVYVGVKDSKVTMNAAGDDLPEAQGDTRV